MFTPVTTRSGALRLSWEPPSEPLEEARVWLLLVDPATLRPDDLHPERLLRELIRLPVDASRGGCLVHAPVSRPLGLALVGRGADDAPRTIPLTSAIEAAVAEPTSAERPQPARKEPPPTHARTLDSAPRAPLGALIAATPAAAQPLLGVSELAARLLATAPRPPAPPSPGGFGVSQPWYLARLSFAAPPDAERRLVRRETFIAGAEVASWRDAPPPEALRVPSGCDGLVDGLTEEGRTSFYVVLASGPGGAPPWLPLPLTPVPPPFSACAAPIVLGPARARLSPPLPPDAPAPLRELREAALRGLP